MLAFFFFKQKTAYEMRISDWSSDVCSSDLRCDDHVIGPQVELPRGRIGIAREAHRPFAQHDFQRIAGRQGQRIAVAEPGQRRRADDAHLAGGADRQRSGGAAVGTRSSEERSVGKEGVSTCRSRWSPSHSKKTTKDK